MFPINPSESQAIAALPMQASAGEGGAHPGMLRSNSSPHGSAQIPLRVAVAAVNLTEITYLIHVRAEIGFEVKVARASSREVGLTFLKRLPLDRNLDQNLLFLWRLCLERASR
jgi:hypothetical protein